MEASLSPQTLLASACALPIDQAEFRLAPEQWEAFCERLDAPLQTIPALQRLLDEPEPY